jgi:mono/diheme cytochrome c family protein
MFRIPDPPRGRALRAALAAFGVSFGVAQTALADGTAFFSAPQVSEGRWGYALKCSACHGAQLQRGGAPALKGKLFGEQWNGKALREFYGYVHSNMPLGQGGDLDSQEYADIVSYVLAQNGLPAVNEKLTPKSPMDRALDLSPGALAGSATAGVVPAKVLIGELYGRLSQPSTARPTQAELDADDAATTNWLMYNKGHRGESYSPLTTINVGKLVFKLPMTTVLNHDVPLTPEGVRVCPVAGVQWNGAVHSRATGLLHVNAIDWRTVFKAGPDPKWVAGRQFVAVASGSSGGSIPLTGSTTIAIFGQ